MLIDVKKNEETGLYETNLNAKSADLDANKEVTIDVSQYENPVEINPTSGKDGMEKATVTLSNIPSNEPLLEPRTGMDYILSIEKTSPIRMNCYSTGQDGGFIFVFGTPKVGDLAYQFTYNSGDYTDPMWRIGHVATVTETHEYPFSGEITLEEYPEVTYSRNGYYDISTDRQN